MAWWIPLFGDIGPRQFPSDRQKAYMWLSDLSIIRKRTEDRGFEKVKPDGHGDVAAELSLTSQVSTKVPPRFTGSHFLTNVFALRPESQRRYCQADAWQ